MQTLQLDLVEPPVENFEPLYVHPKNGFTECSDSVKKKFQTKISVCGKIELNSTPTVYDCGI